jgi:hypothetical protein
MALHVGFETFEGGSWKMMELKNGNTGHLKAITVGSRDFVLKGTQKQIVKWLYETDLPVKVFEGYGDEVWMILRGKAATVSEEMAKAYGGAIGVGGLGSLVTTGVSAFTQVGPLVSALIGVATNPTDYSIDSMVEKAMDKVFGSKVTVRLSSSKGTYASHGLVKDSVSKLPAGLSSKWTAGVVACLKW